MLSVKITLIYSDISKMAKPQVPAYPLRMPPELRLVIEERAKENKRSLNAEIVSLLEQGINSPTTSSASIEEMEAQNEKLKEIAANNEQIRLDWLNSTDDIIKLMTINENLTKKEFTKTLLEHWKTIIDRMKGKSPR